VDPKGQPRAGVFDPFTKDDYGGDTMRATTRTIDTFF
jgi:hypothetical protein